MINLTIDESGNPAFLQVRLKGVYKPDDVYDESIWEAMCIIARHLSHSRFRLDQ